MGTHIKQNELAVLKSLENTQQRTRMQIKKSMQKTHKCIKIRVVLPKPMQIQIQYQNIAHLYFRPVFCNVQG